MLARRRVRADVRKQRSSRRHKHRSAYPLLLLALLSGSGLASASAPRFGFAASHSDCNELVPSTSVVQSAVPLQPKPVLRLDVLVVADAASIKEARRIFESTPAAYAPLGIRLVPRYRLVPTVPDLAGDAERYLRWVKGRVGGRPPAGTDLVYLATARPIGVSGQADCIGGIARPEHAFAVGTLGLDGLVGVNVSGSPVSPPDPVLENGGAKLAAHEIGHLLGAHHHYGPCAPAVDPADPTHPCDVMNTLPMQQVGLRFGPVNAAVVRDSMERYATGRDSVGDP